MSDWHAETYGAHWAPFYDTIFDKVDQSQISFLAARAGDPARALELAIGSGRVALPLADAGVEVVGIDISPEMLSKLRDKPGGDAIEVLMGDFADVEVGERHFPLVYLGFNTLFALTTQQRQVECFINVAGALEPGGRFVIECFVPDLGRYDKYHTRIGVSSIRSDTEHAFELSIHDPVTQQVMSHQVRREADGSEIVLPVLIRYAWPAEIDLMAKLAGLDLEERWDWYDRSQFTADSGHHVSVYRKG